MVDLRRLTLAMAVKGEGGADPAEGVGVGGRGQSR